LIASPETRRRKDDIKTRIDNNDARFVTSYCPFRSSGCHAPPASSVSPGLDIMQPGDILVYFGLTGCSNKATRPERHRTGGANVLVGRSSCRGVHGCAARGMMRRRRCILAISTMSQVNKSTLVSWNAFAIISSLFCECMIVRVQGWSCETPHRVISSPAPHPLEWSSPHASTYQLRLQPRFLGRPSIPDRHGSRAQQVDNVLDDMLDF
jgi:hypothetical protein